MRGLIRQIRRRRILSRIFIADNETLSFMIIIVVMIKVGVRHHCLRVIPVKVEIWKCVRTEFAKQNKQKRPSIKPANIPFFKQFRAVAHYLDTEQFLMNLSLVNLAQKVNLSRHGTTMDW